MSKKFYTIVLLTILLLVILPPVVLASAGTEGEHSEIVRGLIFIMIGQQFVPIGYGFILKSLHMESNDSNDASVNFLSNILKLGVVSLLIGVILILGGFGHIL